jgi:hypothetical protein
MSAESRQHGRSPPRVVPRAVVWSVVVIFALVNAAILIRARMTRRPVQPEAPARQVEYGQTVSWSGTDVLGRTLVIPSPDRAVLLTEVDPAQAQETLARIRTLTTGRCGTGEAPPVLVLAATGTGEDRRTLASMVGPAGHVVDRRELTAILGGAPRRRSPWPLMVVEPGGTVALSLHTTKPRDLRVLLAQWYDWRWTP